MKIIPIFVDDTTSEGLHSIQYDGESNNEFDRIFELWSDGEYILEYCKQNQKDIFSYFTGVGRLEDFAETILDEAELLQELFLNFNNDGFAVNSGMLQTIFKPLINHDFSNAVLQAGKAKIDKSSYFKIPVLRLYALKINKNTFIVTGGCIKFVHRMEDCEDCEKELEKISVVKAFLNKNEYITEDDLTYYYDQSK